MSYDRHQGQMISRVAMLRDADWPKAGHSPVASLQDPKTGDNYFMGFNHPAAIPGCRGLWVFDSNEGYSWDHSFKGYNLTGVNIQAGNYVDDIFGRGYKDFTSGVETRFYNGAGLFNSGLSRTFEVVIKTAAISAESWIIQCGANGNSNAASGGIRLNASGSLSISLYDGVSYSVPASTQLLEDNTYYHLALAMDMDANMHTLYVNGVPWIEQPLVQNYSSTTMNIGCHWASATKQFNGTIFSARVTVRVLQPWEFMHMWYFNSISQGVMGDGAILFDPEVSGFSRKTSVLVTGEWLSDGEMNYGNIIVGEKEGIADTAFRPARNDPEILLPGSLPLVDDKCLCAWIFDGRLDENGDIPDLTGNGFPAVRGPGLVESTLDFNRYGRFYEANGTDEYALVPDLLPELNHYQDNFTIDAFIRVSATTTSKMLLGTNLNETRAYLSIYSDVWDFGVADQGWGVSSTIEPTNVPDVSWHLFSIVKDGSSAYLFVDGTLAASKSGLTWNGWTDNAYTLFAYSSLGGTYAIDKMMAFARISKVVRTKDEMKQMMYALDRLDGYVQDIMLPGGTSLSRRADG